MHLEEMLHRLRNAEDEIERSKAAEQLIDYKGERVILALIEALDDEDMFVRVSAAATLEKRQSDAGPYLRAALSDPRLSIRWGVADVLFYHPSPETEDALRTALGDGDPHVRGAAARSLRGTVEERATLSALENLLDDPDNFPRYQALRTLEASGSHLVDDAKILQRDLNSEDPMKRVAAIHYIRKQGKREWLDEIVRLRKDPDIRVSRAADWAWERLEEKPS